MTELAIQHSTFSVAAVEALVKEKYTLEPPLRCRLFKQTLNDLYLLESAGEHYIFRVWWTYVSDSVRLEMQLELQAKLYQHGSPVPEPLLHQNGAYLHSMNAPEGIRAGALFRYIAGEPGGRDMTATQGERFGRSLANLHTTLDSLDSASLTVAPRLDAEHLLLEPLHKVKHWADFSAQQVKTLEQVCEPLMCQFSELDFQTNDYGLCHGDAHGMNVVFDSSRTSLLDFDFYGSGYRAYDLAVFCWWIRGTVQQKELEAAFLAAYASERPLPDHIPLFAAARELFMTGQTVSYAARGIYMHVWPDDTLLAKRIRYIETQLGRV